MMVRKLKSGVVLICVGAPEGTLLWASKGRNHTFNHDLVNSPDPTGQVSSVWRIPAVPRREKLHGYHPTQKPLRLIRRALVASTREGGLVFDPFCGSGTSGVAAKELGRFFRGGGAREGLLRTRGAAHKSRRVRERAARGYGATPRRVGDGSARQIEPPLGTPPRGRWLRRGPRPSRRRRCEGYWRG